ncbi:MAG: Archaeal histone A1 [Methanonatronarchaeales archaeon]|nr:Archaeal histone A1 [Methanonatronarchaeales archaeon]
MSVIPNAPVKRLLKENNPRVSDDAVDEAVKVLERVTRDLGIEGGKLAKHAGRKTLKRSDVELAEDKLGIG